MNRYFALSIALMVAAPAVWAKSDPIRRLSPVVEQQTAPPRDCRVISVLSGSPASHVGLQVGDHLLAVNGVVPADATAISDLITKSQENATLELSTESGQKRVVNVRLNSGHPRLGIVCDLSGFQKMGLSAAGNVSLTLFDGPYSFTASGIIDKDLMFTRVRFVNNSDRAVKVTSEMVAGTDGSGVRMASLTPKEAMCFLHGDKGPQLLAEKLEKVRSEMKVSTSAIEDINIGDQSCPPEADPKFSKKGHLTGSTAEFANANAEYIARESLWPTTLMPGAYADGLVYFHEPYALPVTLRAVIDDHPFTIKLGNPQASLIRMKEDDLVDFFKQQTKGTPLRVTLRRGRVFVGKFSQFDDIEEKVWFDTASGGLTNATGFPLRTIQAAEKVDQIPAAPAKSGEHIN